MSGISASVRDMGRWITVTAAEWYLAGLEGLLCGCVLLTVYVSLLLLVWWKSLGWLGGAVCAECVSCCQEFCGTCRVFCAFGTEGLKKKQVPVGNFGFQIAQVWNVWAPFIIPDESLWRLTCSSLLFFLLGLFSLDKCCLLKQTFFFLFNMSF